MENSIKHLDVWVTDEPRVFYWSALLVDCIKVEGHARLEMFGDDDAWYDIFHKDRDISHSDLGIMILEQFHSNF
jgi:hypothetical protein